MLTKNTAASVVSIVSSKNNGLDNDILSTSKN